MKKLDKVFLGLLIVQALVNLIGALGPELGFDALWYHLTEAKLFRQAGSLAPIPGNLLYWSGLPRLGEIFYMFLPGKLVHWFFGLLSAYFIFRLGGVASALLWYSLPLVGWLSTSAYVDLIVTAFLLGAVVYRHKKQILFLILAGATKIHALAYGVAITLIPWAIIGYLPFMWINWRSTGNPVYPFGSGFGFESEWFFEGVGYWLSRPLRLWLDPVFRVGPIVLILWLLKPRWDKLLALSLLIWILMPGTDFGRFALFPLALLASKIQVKTRLAIALVFVQAIVGISGRAFANSKYLEPDRTKFLCSNLKFHFGDFCDCDGWFKRNIKPTDKVLIYDVHNLYYVDFPFDHESWQNPETKYTHILVGNNHNLPEKHQGVLLMYHNPITQVTLYLNETE